MSSLFSFWKPTSPQAPVTTPKKKRDRRNESFSAQRKTSPASPGNGGCAQTVNVLQKRKRQVTYATPGASPAKRRPQRQQREGETNQQWNSIADSPGGGFNSSYQFLSGLFSPSPSKRLEEEQRRREREKRETAVREQELEIEREREAQEQSRHSLATHLLPWATQKFSSSRKPLSLYEEALEEEYEEQEGYDYQSSMSSAPIDLIELSSDDEAADDFLAEDTPMGDTPFRPKAIKPRPVFDDNGVFLAATIDPPDYLDSSELDEYRDLLEQERDMRAELDRIRREAAVAAKRDASSLLSKLEKSAESSFLRDQAEQEEGRDLKEEEWEEEDASDEPAFKEKERKRMKERREHAIEEGLEELRSMAEAHKKRMFKRARDAERWRVLTEEEEDAIDDATHGREQEVVVKGFNMEIKRLDIVKVTGTEWLGDEAINFYMNLLKQREERYPGCYLKCHFFNTFFYNMLSSRGYDYSRVRRWTLKFDLFALDKVIIPVHMGAHWCLSVINFRRKRVEYYDSMGGLNIECLKKLERYIQDEYLNKKKCGPYDMTGWTRYTPGHTVPQQANGYDCGMFMCKFADCHALGDTFDFSQRDMRYFRQRMILEIITKEATM